MYIEVFNSKSTGNRCVALRFNTRAGKPYRILLKREQVLDILDVSPSKYASLEVGKYEIKQPTTEVKEEKK